MSFPRRLVKRGGDAMDHLVEFDDPGRNGVCRTEPDIAGIGVIISFIAASVLTSILSIYAAIVDAKLGKRHAPLPSPLVRWLSRGRSKHSLRRLTFRRVLLDRSMVALSDQQLITGFALLLNGLIRKKKLGEAHFHLVVLVSCLSSSSHLASLITLKEYLNEHIAAAWGRISLIVSFAVMVAASLDISGAFKPFWELYELAITPLIWDASKTVIAIVFYVVPPFVVLYPFWLSLIQISPGLKDQLEAFLCRRFHALTTWFRGTRLFQRLHMDKKKPTPRWRKCLGSAVKKTFWFLLFSNATTIFTFQILFAVVSLVFVLLQKFGRLTTGWDATPCNLNTDTENQWSFGQTLPLLLLLQPFFAALVTYLELRDDLKSGRMNSFEMDQASTTDSRRASRVASVTRRDIAIHRPSVDLLSIPEAVANGNCRRRMSFHTVAGDAETVEYVRVARSKDPFRKSIG